MTRALWKAAIGRSNQADHQVEVPGSVGGLGAARPRDPLAEEGQAARGVIVDALLHACARRQPHAHTAVVAETTTDR